MKSCPKCFRSFPEDASFCAHDGEGLAPASTVRAVNSEDPRVGTLIFGRYEVRRIVADGGMGRVYEGIDIPTDTRIAIKVLHDDVARDEVSLARFKREYEISSKLVNDYVVRVLDFQRDEAAGVWLLVMEFLEGEELRVVLKRDKYLAPARVVRMVAQVAIGLDAAHASQFIHRDLKPDNLFMCGARDGDRTKILDFGSVKDKNANAPKLTVMGTTIGSPFYMAPEQAQGLETLDSRADVFALAAISYECIVGTVPFSGNNGPSILLAILTEDPPPPTVAGRKAKYPIPAAMDEVMELALAKNPNHRQATVGAFADALGHAYGLPGTHQDWARTPLAELTVTLEASQPAERAEAQGDPFAARISAAPDPFASAAAPPRVSERPPTPVPPVPELAPPPAEFWAQRAPSAPPPPPVVVAKTPAWLVPAIAAVVLLAAAVVALLVLR
ncbi:MAG TPA: serine/threonine-protein kinase [Polyangiaceae bacterium]|nr:serine/threonine-protein kinase [Polyangiaceae bacterium]